ncbi:MAG: YdiU family protein [Proteobacteria bacterium]|nr:YdiU family protein [Pseudomonadota bacterium]
MKFDLFNFDNSYSRLAKIFFSQIDPSPVRAPKIVILNEDLLKDLDLKFSALSSEEKAALFSGNILPKNSEPIAQAYAGHQYGGFVILGDGRAILLGEHLTRDKKRADIQLKGSGQTPYSRRGDGRAALAPMLREYLISEAMHALSVPTTRSLAVVATGEDVYRETLLPGAILTRVASSHIRVGTFQFAAAMGSKKDVEDLINYTIARHFPHKNNAQELLKIVIERQADLIVNWLRVGFIHGVMNTDNMSISGETIDYGPCAFIDEYDPATVFSSIDSRGRYAFANQAPIAQWNLARFAETLLPFLSREIAENEIENFRAIFQEKYLAMMRKKLGLFGVEEGDKKLIEDLLDWMQKSRADYTNTFRNLSSVEGDWQKNWRTRLEKNNQSLEASQKLMDENNPAIIPRNHKVEEALQAANDADLEPFHNLLAALKNPYENSANKKSYQLPPTEFQRVTQTFCGT